MSKKVLLSILNKNVKNTLIDTLDIKFVDVGEDFLVASMPVNTKVYQPDKILHGGINIISSNLEISNLKIANSQSEDAINIVSSNTKIKNLNIENSFSDGIDIDFGNVSISKITCLIINNDCLDV